MGNLSAFSCLACRVISLATLIASPLLVEGQTAAKENAENLTVMLDAFFPGDPIPESGTGFIVSVQGATLYVVTAAHVVKKSTVVAKSIKVSLRWIADVPAPDAKAQATFLTSQGDLAVLKVSLSPDAIPGPDILSFWAIAGIASLNPGDGIQPLGHPRGQNWVSCSNEPDHLDSAVGGMLLFTARCVEPGDSGGPLVDENWRIIGMIQMDQQPTGKALGIESVVNTLKGLSVPVDLEPVNAPDANTFADLTVGDGAACGVTLKGRVNCWGSNAKDALGIGSDRDFVASIGVPVADVHHFSKVSAGVNDACAISVGGAAYCWGDFFSGGPKSRPTLAQNSPQFVSITKGANHACGVTVDGMAFCWGSNSSGQLGDGTKNDKASPVPVTGSVRWLTLAAGFTSTCGISTAHQAYCWGDNKSHLAPSTDPALATPLLVAGSHTFNQISAGGFQDIGGDGNTKLACGIDEGGALFCWGGRVARFPGFKEVLDPSQPVELAPGMHFLSVGAGTYSVCAITNDHKVVCWGKILWDSHDPQAPKSMLPIDGISNASRVFVGKDTACALRIDSKAVCWPVDVESHLGDGGDSSLRDDRGRHFVVRISVCPDQGIAKVPGSLDTTEDGLNFIDGMPADAVFRAGVGEVSAAVQVASGMVQACEMFPTDPMVTALSELRSIEEKISSLTEFDESIKSKETVDSEAAQVHILLQRFKTKIAALKLPEE